MIQLRRPWAIALLSAVTLSVLAHDASAALLTTGDIVKVTRRLPDGNSTVGRVGGGGEFALYKQVAADDWEFLFVTFCAQMNESISMGQHMVVGALSSVTVGKNKTMNPLDIPTDFLYSGYRTGDLSFFTNFQYDNTDWANALQQAIWHFEDGLTDISTKAWELVNAANDVTSGFYESQNVQAINLFLWTTPQSDLDVFDPYDTSTWPRNGLIRQDLLYWTESLEGPDPGPSPGPGPGPGPGPDPGPDPGPNPVPEPGTFALWGMLFVLAAGGKRFASRVRRDSTTSHAS